MVTELERPRFLPSFLDALKRESEENNWWAVIPIWLVVFVGGGIGAAFLVPADFWLQSGLEISAAVYAAILTINGLILALSWGAFSRIYDIIGASGFSSYLMRNNLLNRYILFVGFVHIAQLVAIGISGAALFILLLDIPVLYDRLVFGVMVGLSIYAIKQGAGAVTAMHDLIWQKSLFDDRPDQSNVVGMDGRKE